MPNPSVPTRPDPPDGSLQCVILSGGLATRLGDLAADRPKHLVPVAGVPFADLQLAWLRDHGVTHVVECVGHLGEQIRRHLGDGGRFGMRIDYIDEGDARLGTAGALRLALDHGVLHPRFLVLYGDSLLRCDPQEVMSDHCRARTTDHPDRMVTMTVLHNRDLWDASNVAFDRDSGVVERYDKSRPDAWRTRMEWIDYGLSALERVALEAVPPTIPCDLADVYRLLSESGRVGGVEVTERFFEVGTPAALAELERHLESRVPHERFPAGDTPASTPPDRETR